jgi:hypothetical protein
MVTLIIILIMPSLTTLSTISMLLCLVSFGLIVTISWGTSSDDAIRTEEHLIALKNRRLEEISKNIDQPNERLAPASIETLKREAKKIRHGTALVPTDIKAIIQDAKQANNASYESLKDASKNVLNREKGRLSKLITTRGSAAESSLIIGVGAVFAIINGLGISEALDAYFDNSDVNPTPPGLEFNNTQTSLKDMVTLDWSYTIRVLGYLATIIPFIHGFVLTLTTKWYYNEIKGHYQYKLAFLFFLAIFIQTVLFFLLAINVEDISRYILSIWWVLVFNIIWLPVQLALTFHVLQRTDSFLLEWIILNFNTVAFLSVFVFVYPGLPEGNSTLNKDLDLNLQITIVLVLRSVSDYIVGWRKVYNKEA